MSLLVKQVRAFAKEKRAATRPENRLITGKGNMHRAQNAALARAVALLSQSGLKLTPRVAADGTEKLPLGITQAARYYAHVVADALLERIVPRAYEFTAMRDTSRLAIGDVHAADEVDAATHGAGRRHRRADNHQGARPALRRRREEPVRHAAGAVCRQRTRREPDCSVTT